MSKRTMEFAGLMALVILAVANLEALGNVVSGIGDTAGRLAHGWHALVVNHRADGVADTDAQVASNGESISDVLGFESTDDIEVRKAALYALAESLDEARLIAFLERVALDPLQPDLGKAAVYQLGDVRENADAVRTLGRIIDGSVHESIRKAAVYALGDLAGSSNATADVSELAVNILATCIESDRSVAVRKAAVYALSESRTPRAQEVLLKLADNLVM